MHCITQYCDKGGKALFYGGKRHPVDKGDPGAQPLP